MFSPNKEQLVTPVTRAVLEPTDKLTWPSQEASSQHGSVVGESSQVLKRKLCAISRAFHQGKEVQLLANRTLNIYVVHPYTVTDYIIVSMLTTTANEV